MRMQEISWSDVLIAREDTAPVSMTAAATRRIPEARLGWAPAQCAACQLRPGKRDGADPRRSGWHDLASVAYRAARDAS